MSDRGADRGMFIVMGVLSSTAMVGGFLLMTAADGVPFSASTAVGAAGFAMAGAFMWRGNHAFERMVSEINERCEANQRIPLFGPSWKQLDVVERHKQLFPGSDLPKRYWRSVAGMFAVMGIGAALVVIMGIVKAG